MRFLCDIPIGLATVEYLRQLGHDCIRVIDRLPPTAEDEEIVQLAIGEERVILCFDLEFSTRVAVSGRVTPSIITFRMSREGAEAINQRLAQALPELLAELPNGVLVTVEDTRVRVRPLPILRAD